MIGLFGVDVFKVIGGVGLVLIAAGILVKERRTQDWFYVFGGGCLEIYSVSINDVIFMVLQAVFVLAAVYDLVRKPLAPSTKK